MFWKATGVFLAVYAIIILEKVNKTIVAVLWAGVVLALKILNQNEAIHMEELGVDYNVIYLHISMMVIVNMIKPTGFFEFIAIKSAKPGHG